MKLSHVIHPGPSLTQEALVDEMKAAQEAAAAQPADRQENDALAHEVALLKHEFDTIKDLLARKILPGIDELRASIREMTGELHHRKGEDPAEDTADCNPPLP